MPEIQGYLKPLPVWSQLEPAARGWQSTAPACPIHPGSSSHPARAAGQASGLRQRPSPAASAKQGHFYWDCATPSSQENTDMWMLFDKSANFVLIPNQSCLGLTCLIFPSLLKTSSWHSLEGNLMLSNAIVKWWENTKEEKKEVSSYSYFLIWLPSKKPRFWFWNTFDRRSGFVSTTPRASNIIILIPSIWYSLMSPCKITVKAKNT